MATSSLPATSTGSRRSGSSAVAAVPLFSFILLAAVYFLYVRHADFVLDDWFQFLFYRQHQSSGIAGRLEVARVLLQNTLYHTFQLYWLSFLADSCLVWMVGYAPRLLFLLVIAEHLANVWLFYRLLLRLRLPPRLAYLAAAAFVLLPTSHGPLFWYLGTSFYVRPPIFLFLYLLSLIRSFERNTLPPRPAAWQALLVILILFSGGAPSFCLLLFAGLWMAACFFPRSNWKLAAKAAALNWAVTAISLAIYVPFINRIPPNHEQLAARYDFSLHFFLKTLDKAFNIHRRGLSGFGAHPYYRLLPESGQMLAAALVAAVVVIAASTLPAGSPASRAPAAGRAALFAAGMLILGYLPLAFLIGLTLRHYYTLSPYLALFSVALCFLPSFEKSGFLPIAAAALLCAYSAACTAAEIQQCWVPMSRHLQAVKAGLRRLQNLEAGDLVVIPGFPLVTGTAPNFALISAPWDRCFAEVVTGVKGLQFWREIVVEKGRLRLFHRHMMRDTSIAELGRAHVLSGDPGGPYTARRYWAEETAPGQFRLHCLKDSPCTAEAPAPGGSPADRSDIYFPKPFEHGNVNHLHY
jgi:hypothetical protein